MGIAEGGDRRGWESGRGSKGQGGEGKADVVGGLGYLGCLVCVQALGGGVE